MNYLMPYLTTLNFRCAKWIINFPQSEGQVSQWCDIFQISVTECKCQSKCVDLESGSKISEICCFSPVSQLTGMKLPKFCGECSTQPSLIYSSFETLCPSPPYPQVAQPAAMVSDLGIFPKLPPPNILLEID